MEYKQIKKLMDDMGDSKLTALDIEFPDGIKISMKKDGITKTVEAIKPVEQPTVQVPVAQVPTAQVNVNTQNQTTIQKEVEDEQDVENLKAIKSPMVGTFFSKSSPTASPYVEVGKKVKKGDIVCIVEAMKLMNEIESDVDGEIVEICVNDGDTVDYGKTLFKIR